MDSHFRKHEALLARPFKHKVSKKYVPDNEIKWKKIQRPIVPEKNRRLMMLSEPIRRTEKYEPPDIPSTTISRAALDATCTPRLDHLSRPTVRTLVATKKDKQYLGKAFADMINERIAMSLDTIYYHNVKSLMNIEAARKKSTKSLPPKKTNNWNEIGDKERLVIIAAPKKYLPPPPPPPRKRKKLEELKALMDKLAIPNRVYKRPSQDSMVKKLGVSPRALTYVASERIKELLKPPAWRLVKPFVYTGKVKRSALEYQITERIQQIAAPRPRANAPEMDLKENPYDISPFALKYKATPRIINLAKPMER